MATAVIPPPPIEQPVSPPVSTREADTADCPPDDLVLWRMSVARYHAIARAGILDDDAPVELLDGLLVQKMTKNPPHSVATLLTINALRSLLPSDWFVTSQEPVTLAKSEPEPDIMVVHGEPRAYGRRHPGPADVALVIEVADSTVKRDRGSKKRIYADAKLLVYWVINLIERRIEVYSSPSGRGQNADYVSQQFYHPGDEIPVILDGEEVGRLSVKELLP